MNNADPRRRRLITRETISIIVCLLSSSLLIILLSLLAPNGLPSRIVDRTYSAQQFSFFVIFFFILAHEVN